METDRKETGLGRSAFLRDALRRVKEQKTKESMIQAYISGYRRFPEDPDMAETEAKIAAEILNDDEWK